MQERSITTSERRPSDRLGWLDEANAGVRAGAPPLPIGEAGVPSRAAPISPPALLAKRVLDLTGALILLILTLPISLVAAAAIPLDSRGPSLYRQRRVGARPVVRRGRVEWRPRTFTIYKFRTMTQGADDALHRRSTDAYIRGERVPGGDGAAPFKLGHDPRVTRLGRILRATSLDELPQLINVLRGDMSLVGPRPVPEYEVAHYQPWHRERLQALPGITGLWQVHGRGRVAFDEAVRMDIDYVRNQSVQLDLEILLLTIPAVLARKGAR